MRKSMMKLGRIEMNEEREGKHGAEVSTLLRCVFNATQLARVIHQYPQALLLPSVFWDIVVTIVHAR